MRRFGQEMHQKCIGPMPVKEFFETFFGPELRAVEARIGFKEEGKEKFRLIGEKSSEKEIYEPLVRSLGLSCCYAISHSLSDRGFKALLQFHGAHRYTQPLRPRFRCPSP
jgi:hypothetical protein